MNHKEDTDKAWAALQERLAGEPASVYWRALSERQKVEVGETDCHESSADLSLDHSRKVDRYEEPIIKTSRVTRWMKRRRKWALAAAVAGLVTFSLATPLGNNALAAILNEFRMQQITVVQENDVLELMNHIAPDGQYHEAFNKFGTVSRVSGTLNGEYGFEQAERLLNRKLVLPADYSGDKVYITPSEEITLRINIPEVNKALKRLGSNSLLPESIDGKPVKLTIGSAYHLYVDKMQGGQHLQYSFTQQPVPVIDADPSIPIQDALDAVVKFPFLPEGLRQILTRYQSLENGALPIPVISNGNAEMHKVDGIDMAMAVISSRSKEVLSSSSKEVLNTPQYYEMNWVKDGQVFSISGSGFADKNAALDAAAELIRQ